MLAFLTVCGSVQIQVKFRVSDFAKIRVALNLSLLPDRCKLTGWRMISAPLVRAFRVPFKFFLCHVTLPAFYDFDIWRKGCNLGDITCIIYSM